MAEQESPFGPGTGNNPVPVNGIKFASPDDGTKGIQDAIDSLPSSGGVVRLLSGRYEVNNVSDPFDEFPIHITKDNLAIIGAGWGTEIFLPDGSTSASSGGDKGSRIIHDGGVVTDTNPDYHDGTVLMHFTVNGNQQNNGGTGDGENITDQFDGHNIQLNGDYNFVHNVRSINATGDGIEPITYESPTTCNYSVVSNCVFEGNYEQDMHNHGASNILYINNICRNEKTNGSVMLYSDHADSENVYFFHNHLEGGDNVGAILHNPGGGYNSKNIHFAHNTVLNFAEHGVRVSRPGGLAQHDGVYIYENVIKGNAQTGILLNGAKNVHIKNNEISDNGFRGIDIRQDQSGEDVEELFVSGNYIFNNNQTGGNNDGIRFQIDGDAIRNVILSGNNIHSDSAPYHRQGILVEEISAGTYQDIILKDNWVRGISTFARVNDQTGSALIRNNHNANNTTSSPPSSVESRPGTWYLDDGTNTGNGNIGLRVYDGSAWVDAWTL